jgi:hypothetical protein
MKYHGLSAARTDVAVNQPASVLPSLGSRIEDVAGTRVCFRNAGGARGGWRALRSRLTADTLVQAGSIGDDYRVEMEAEAMIGNRTPDPTRIPIWISGPFATKQPTASQPSP